MPTIRCSTVGSWSKAKHRTSPETILKVLKLCPEKSRQPKVTFVKNFVFFFHFVVGLSASDLDGLVESLRNDVDASVLIVRLNESESGTTIEEDEAIELSKEDVPPNSVFVRFLSLFAKAVALLERMAESAVDESSQEWSDGKWICADSPLSRSTPSAAKINKEPLALMSKSVFYDNK